MSIPTRRAALLLALCACGERARDTVVSPDDTDRDDTPSATDTAASDTETTPTWYAPPTRLEATCTPEENTLRFTCHVTVEPAQPVQVRFSRIDGVGAERVHASPAAATEHDVGLYMMAASKAYTWTASATAWPQAPVVTGTATTGVPQVAVIPTSIYVAGTSSVPYVGTPAPCTSLAIATIYDTATGDLVWYQALDLMGIFGWYDMVRFTEDHTVLGETGDKVVEVDRMGNVLLDLTATVDYTGFLHHDVFKKDGYVYTLFNDNGLEVDPLIDGLHVFDASTGEKVLTWRAGDTIAIPPDASGDWMHTNTVWVDDAGDIYLSSYGQNSVVKVKGDPTSPSFGEKVWALAGSVERGFGMDFTEDWSLVGGADVFIHQHDVSRLADGRLILLDNWNGRGLVIALDEVAMTSRVEEAYTVGDGGKCGPQGTANASSAGNLFFACSGPDLYEFAPLDPEPVWQAHASCNGQYVSVLRWYPLEGW